MWRKTLAVFAALGIALGLAACGGSNSSAEPRTPETAAASGTAGPAVAAVSVEVETGEPVGGPKELTVSKGETVSIEVSVDAPQEIHVHGYEVEAQATPDAPAVLEFPADLEGIFDVESHASDALLVTLVVEP